MQVIRPRFATHFYPSLRRACAEAIDRMAAQVSLPDNLPSRARGGLVPHAGWVYSGLTAAHLWTALAEADEPPEVLVLLGAVHVRGVDRPTVYSGHAWDTPLGPVDVDRRLASRIVLEGQGTVASGRIQHDGEHSLEVQAPFIRRLLPGTDIVPIAVPADARAIPLGAVIARAVAADGRRAVIIASSDLTHYGERYGFAPQGTGDKALAWSKANDRRLVDRALEFDAAGVLAEARSHHNACGAGALAASIAAVTADGADQAFLLHQTTSYEVRPKGAPDMFVGYASILFS
jgi:AmmeMemoRadiSam system protein B